MSVVARGLTKRYGARVVLDACDLEAPEGSIVLIAGSNGSGKSTLLRCLAGLARCEGEVRMLGAPPGRARGGEVAYLPQSVELPCATTVREILDLFGADERDAPADWLPPATARIGGLSGGELQRVAILATLSPRPRVALLDEPTADLDGPARASLFAWLARLRDAGTTVLVTAPAPDRDELARAADRRVDLVGGGRCVQAVA
ncbi:MAG TPA: ATP-binding cassette domain-containing protein [Candidatus Limnocylindria bacterium]|nr:ATP-binding cassette domain-containing protein [Candidatus Limnocylindria bacterium]